MYPRLATTIAVVALTVGLISPPATAQKIYWTDGVAQKIQRADLDGSNVEDLLATGPGALEDIALDLTADKMYWADFVTGKIQRADLDGANVEEVVAEIVGLTAIALDAGGGKVYWTHAFDLTGGIQRADLDGSNVETVVNAENQSLWGIALDLTTNKMYWVMNAGILRANLDGSNVEPLVTSGLNFPVGIALDVPAGKMYWSDGVAKKIQRADLDGSNVEDLITTGLEGPWGIALDRDGGKIYWAKAAHKNGKIRRADLDGSNVEDVVATGLQGPGWVALDVRPPPPPIPALSDWGMVAMACSLLVLACVTIIRRGRTGQAKVQSTARSFCLFVICGAAASIGVSTTVIAQPAEVPAETVAMSIDSGMVSATGTGAEPAAVFSRVVSVPGAPWIRLHFQQIQLSGSSSAGNEAFLRISSLQEGSVQILDLVGLDRWGNTSAYFNGDSVLVELRAYPGTGQNRIVIDKIVAGLGGVLCSVGSRSICGATDDRVLSTDLRAGRFRFHKNLQCNSFLECTAFLVNDRPNWLLTAGHCCFDARGAFNFGCDFPPTVEFNVPLSNPDGSENCALPEDQYPVDRDSILCQARDNPSKCEPGGVGDDWCLFGVFDNQTDPMNPHTPLDKQGASYRLATVVPTGDGSIVRVAGYGADNDPLEHCHVQQDSTGPYTKLEGTTIKYEVDAAGGNSGSAVEQECQSLVYGILTNDGCGVAAIGANQGTAITHPNLQDALIPNYIDGGTCEPQGVCADCNGNGINDVCDTDCAAPGARRRAAAASIATSTASRTSVSRTRTASPTARRTSATSRPAQAWTSTATSCRMSAKRRWARAVDPTGRVWA